MIVHPIVKDDTVLFCDMSDNVVEQAQAFAIANSEDTERTEPWYTDFCYDMLRSHLLPFFEWHEDTLILVTIRPTENYEYLKPDIIRALSAPYYIPMGNKS